MKVWLLALVCTSLATPHLHKPDEAEHFLLLAAERSLTSKLQKQAKITAASELPKTLGDLGKLELLWKDLEKTQAKLATAEHAALLQSRGPLPGTIPEAEVGNASSPDEVDDAKEAVLEQQVHEKAHSVEEAAEELLQAQAKESRAWLQLSDAMARLQNASHAAEGAAREEQEEDEANHDLQSRKASFCNSSSTALKSLRKAKAQAKHAMASFDSLQRLFTAAKKRATFAQEESSQADGALNSTEALQALAKKKAKEKDEKLEEAMAELNKRNIELQDHLAHQQHESETASTGNASQTGQAENTSTSNGSSSPKAFKLPNSSKSFPPLNSSKSFLPSNSSESFQPLNSSKSFQPANSSTAIQPANSSKSFQPLNSSKSFQPANSSTAIQPANSSKSFQPLNSSKSFQPVNSSKPFQPQNASGALHDAFQGQNSSASLKNDSAKKLTNSSNATQTIPQRPESAKVLPPGQPVAPQGQPFQQVHQQANALQMPRAPQKPALAELAEHEGRVFDVGRDASAILQRARALLADAAAVSRHARDLEDCRQKGKPCSNLEVSQLVTPAPSSSTTAAENWIPHKAGQAPSPPPAPSQPSAFNPAETTTTTSSSTTSRYPTAIQPVMLPPTSTTPSEITDEYPARSKARDVSSQKESPDPEDTDEAETSTITTTTSISTTTSAASTSSTSATTAVASTSQTTSRTSISNSTSTTTLTTTHSAAVSTSSLKSEIRRDVDKAADGQAPAPEVPADEEEDAAADAQGHPIAPAEKNGTEKGTESPEDDPSESQEEDSEDDASPLPAEDSPSPCASHDDEPTSPCEESDSDLSDLPTSKDPWLSAVREQARLVSLLATRSKAAQVRSEGISAAAAAAAEVASKLQGLAKDQKEALDVINGGLQASENRSKSLNASVTLAKAAYNKLRLECESGRRTSILEQRLGSDLISADSRNSSSQAEKALEQAQGSVEEEVRVTDQQRMKLKALVLSLANLTESLQAEVGDLSPQAIDGMQQDSQEQGPRTILPFSKEDRSQATFSKPQLPMLLILVGMLS